MDMGIIITHMKKMKNNRYLGLDILRVVSALMVVFYHYFYHFHNVYDTGDSSFLFSVGKYGVVVFFVISGFVISSTISSSRSYNEFLFKRISRLFPTYWMGVITTFLFLHFFYLKGRMVSIDEMLVNLTMFQQIFGIKNVDGSYWTLIYELFFYIIFGWVLFRKLNITTVVSILTLLVYFSKFITITEDFYPLFLYEYGVFFAFGIIIYVYRMHPIIYNKKLFILSCVLVFYLFTFRKYPFVDLFFIIVVFYASSPMVNEILIPVRRGLVILSLLTYPIYLIHQNISYSIFVKFGTTPAVYISAFLFIIIVSVIILKLDMFIQKMIKRIYD